MFARRRRTKGNAAKPEISRSAVDGSGTVAKSPADTKSKVDRQPEQYETPELKSSGFGSAGSFDQPSTIKDPPGPSATNPSSEVLPLGEIRAQLLQVKVFPSAIR